MAGEPCPMCGGWVDYDIEPDSELGTVIVPRPCPLCSGGGAHGDDEAKRLSEAIDHHHADFLHIKQILDQSLRYGVMDYRDALRQIDEIVR